MPNHVQNRIVTQSNILDMLTNPKADPNQDKFIDFGQMIEMPERFVEADGWYQWSLDNWGTKWNAYNAVRQSEVELWFTTAWSAPHPVVEKLAESLPHGVQMLHSWADEDAGYNVGQRLYIGGHETKHDDMHNTARGFELAFAFHGGAESYVYNNETENYDYIED